MEFLDQITTYVVGLCTVCAIILNIVRTPPTPDENSSKLDVFVYRLYKAAEFCNAVRDSVKQRPDESKALVEISSRLKEGGLDPSSAALEVERIAAVLVARNRKSIV
jgi:hypothetical protein